MATRDGTILRSDIFRPRTSGTAPALLFRTPYDKKRTDAGREVYRPIAVSAAARGYIVVLQDVRGRHRSDGQFVPFFSIGHTEGDDGYDAVEWVAGLPGCNGRVGTFGDSYGAWLQWELARHQPPHLVAMFPSGLPARALDFPVLRIGRRILWLIARMAPDTRSRGEVALPGPTTPEEAYQLWEEVERGKWYWFLPFRELPREALGGLADPFYELLDRMPVDYLSPQRDHRSVHTPVLHLSGWFDIDVGGSIDHYQGMVEAGGSVAARLNQRLIIGPWTHMDPFYELPQRLGAMDFGPAASLDYVDVLTDWFDRWLKEPALPSLDQPPIRIFVMGRNRWREEQEWPPTGARQQSLYFDSGGQANSVRGNGILDDRPGDGPPDEYTYDPRDPVMSLYDKDAYYAPLDQQPLAHRHDIVVYSTQHLTKELQVIGPVTVELWASSTARDTDFTAKLVDEQPNGQAIGLSTGIVRARYRNGTSTPTLIQPGEAVKYTINLEPTAYVFKAGHRVRIDIASSDFPDYDRNHNTGGNDYYESRLVAARQTILHSATYPSRVVLPVVDS